jgi:hypothetical protein
VNGPLLGAYAGIAASLVGLVIHLARYAYSQGVTHQRLDTLEKTSGTANEVHGLLAALTATVAGLKDTVSELKSAVNDIAPRTARGRQGN